MAIFMTEYQQETGCKLSQQASGARKASRLPPDRLVLCITNLVVQLQQVDKGPSDIILVVLEGVKTRAKVI